MKPTGAAAAAAPKQHGASMASIATRQTRIAMPAHRFARLLLLLSLLLPALLGPATGRAGPAEAETFLRQWRAAVASGEPRALAELSALPGFLFEGQPQDRAGFMRRVVPALFAPRQRACLQQAPALAEPDGRRSIWCRPYGYVFGPDAQGRWKLLALSAEGED